MNNEQDEITAVKGEPENGDSKDYAQADQQAAEGQEEKVNVQVGWGVSEDGVPSVRILQGVVPTSLTVDDAELLTARFTEATTSARRMAEVWKWLTENGVEGDLRAQLVLDANKRTSEEAARSSLLSLGLGGMFRNWG